MGEVVTNVVSAIEEVVDGFAATSVAMVHEAQKRSDLQAPRPRPAYRPVRSAGTVLTCSVATGRNWMVDVATGQAAPRGILVGSPNDPCEDNCFGDRVVVVQPERPREVLNVAVRRGVPEQATGVRRGWEPGLDIYGMRAEVAKRELTYQQAP